MTYCLYRYFVEGVLAVLFINRIRFLDMSMCVDRATIGFVNIIKLKRGKISLVGLMETLTGFLRSACHGSYLNC